MNPMNHTSIDVKMITSSVDVFSLEKNLKLCIKVLMRL